MTDTTYNGWTNYETWAVGMYLDGNYTGEGTYRAVLALVGEAATTGTDRAVENILAGVWTAEQARVFEVEDALKNWTEEQIGMESDDLANGIAADLLNAALSEVNWRELAEHKLQELDES
jgi:hypothetical protein